MALSRRTVVETDWLSKHINDDNLIIADCRYNLMDSSEGRRKYLEGHIPGAFFIDMESDLTGDKEEHGGRHPIPDPALFASRMSLTGLEPGKMVVAYDDDLSGSARLWWLLNYFGHEEAYVLDGGFGKWSEEGRKITTELPKERKGNFTPSVNHDLMYDVYSVRDARHPHVLVDSRSPDRHAGIREPIDFKAGHIPGSINVFYRDVMAGEGKLKDREQLISLYSQAGTSPVVYCGSGITACVNVLGLARIGIEAKLYAGSWSDWISYPDNSVETS